MYQSVNWYQFRDTMQNFDMPFSVDGLSILFNYLEEIEQGQDKEIELDPIALRCDFAEALPIEIAEDYNIDISEAKNDDEVIEIVQDFIDHHSAWVGITDKKTIVYHQF
jgi:hypothetical protein